MAFHEGDSSSWTHPSKTNLKTNVKWWDRFGKWLQSVCSSSYICYENGSGHPNTQKKSSSFMTKDKPINPSLLVIFLLLLLTLCSLVSLFCHSILLWFHFLFSLLFITFLFFSFILVKLRWAYFLVETWEIRMEWVGLIWLKIIRLTILDQT